jgi:hypothetical protein
MNMAHSTEKVRDEAQSKTEVSAEISKVGVYTIAISAGIIGCWAVICLVAGTITSGGPFELLSNLFKAITN